MRDPNSAPVLRSDYRPPPYLVDRIDLVFDLDAEATEVTSTLWMRRNPAAAGAGALVLNGDALELVQVELDGRRLEPPSYELRAGDLVFGLRAPDSFVLRIRNRIHPRANSALMGLFLSNGNLFTQCEAEGFRRIAFFPDRPDVMARYRVELRASPATFPVLLSNGNLVEQGSLPDGRHYARWEDPFPKPSYLFAIVAGRFACREKHIRTASGRSALLQVWVDPERIDQTEHALESLHRAIAWDEQRFGRELDLDRFMIVASNDFNMGAMENKGLNIFNAKYVLASPQIATDTDYANIESIVGHEYFHNWTGNRVTCRDWFQLSLKEGLTVFRDQEFSAEMTARSGEGTAARAIKRIDDVRTLRAVQFPEDAGPMAHPIRPDSYEEISNFYTATVYEKGAEVVRMLRTLLGEAAFRRGLDLYFERHDGQAVTCDDFIAAMGDASGRDLAQFKRWYEQSGTPRVAARGTHDPSTRTFDLTLAQSCAPFGAQRDRLPLLIPVAVGLVGIDGVDRPLRLDGEPEPGPTTRVLELASATQTFRFVDVDGPVIPSLARDFSAPVVVDYAYGDAELAFLAGHDSDPFNRWDAQQRLALARITRAADAIEGGEAPRLDDVFARLVEATLTDPALAHGFRELALQLPAEGFVAESRAVVDPTAIRAARLYVRRELARRLGASFAAAYRGLDDGAPYATEPHAAGRRALKNLALSYVVDGGDAEGLEWARRQLDRGDNLTDRLAALTCIVNSAAPFKAEVLLRIARDWQSEPLLMNKWFHLQATAIAQPGEPPVVGRVRALLRHPSYSELNPNNVYALVLGFCVSNPAEFHRQDGSGYAFWAEQVQRLDRVNPIVAARLARALERWRKFTPDRARRMRAVLDEIAALRGLSRDVREVVGKALHR
ncbi:MAG TPA: aminopeptidase N [Burkholderiaceae bacterium]|nr:aminopeptidase N [Burkholderiaceae bacterium]